MKAKHVLGRDLMLFAGSKAVALSTSCKLTVSAEAMDASTKDSGIWSESVIGKMSWNGSSDSLFSADADANSYDTLLGMMLEREPIDIEFGVSSNQGISEVPEGGWTLSPGCYTGKALITAIDATGANGDKATMSVTFTGTGELSKKKVQ